MKRAPWNRTWTFFRWISFIQFPRVIERSDILKSLAIPLLIHRRCNLRKMEYPRLHRDGWENGDWTLLFDWNLQREIFDFGGLLFRSHAIRCNWTVCRFLFYIYGKCTKYNVKNVSKSSFLLLRFYFLL